MVKRDLLNIPHSNDNEAEYDDIHECSNCGCVQFVMLTVDDGVEVNCSRCGVMYAFIQP